MKLLRLNIRTRELSKALQDLSKDDLTQEQTKQKANLAEEKRVLELLKKYG